MGAVKYLLDTHTFLWAIQKDVALSDTVKAIITDENLQKFVSPVSAYEILNKHRLGKLPEYAGLAEAYFSILSKFGAEELFINTQHTYFAGKFDWLHRDPFDRLLAAQAFIENMVLLTNDEVFDSLPWLNILW